MAEGSAKVFIYNHLQQERSAMIECMKEEFEYPIARLNMEDKVMLIMANWNCVMIAYLLVAFQVKYIDIECDELPPERSPPTLQMCEDVREAVNVDDRPIIDSILSTLMPEVICFEFEETDLVYILRSEVYDIAKIHSCLKDVHAVINAKARSYQDYASICSSLQDLERPRNFNTIRQKIKTLSGQCKKLLLWNDDGPAMRTWLEQQLKQ